MTNTVPSPLPIPLYAGTVVTTTVVFTNPGSSTPVDPSSVALTFIGGFGAPPVTWTYGGTGSINKVAVGTYSAALATAGTEGPWDVKWVGTGACAAVSVAGFLVTSPPF